MLARIRRQQESEAAREDFGAGRSGKGHVSGSTSQKPSRRPTNDSAGQGRLEEPPARQGAFHEQARFRAFLAGAKELKDELILRA